MLARPNTGSYLQLVDHAALFVAPKSSYFLVSDLASIARSDESIDDVALSTLLVGSGAETQTEFEPGAEDTETISYPFPSNRAQRRVALLVDDASTNVVHVEGPPGTGKSLTIANLACHLAATGRTVLITSQKDKALAIVDEKLRELGLDQIPMTLLRRDPASKRELRDRLDGIEKTRSAQEVETDATKFKEEFAGYKEQYQELESMFAAALAAEEEYESVESAARNAVGRLRRIAASWRFRRTRKRLARDIPRGTDEIAEEASRHRQRLLDGALSMLKAELERSTATAKRNERQQLREFSRLLRRDERRFRNFSIFDRLKAQPDRTAMLLKVLPVWIMTPDDAARLFPCQPGLFDVVIVDEASQVDLPSIFPILYRAKKVVISGDPHQMQARRFAFMQELIALEAWHQYGMQSHDPDNWLQPTKQSLLDLAFVRAEEEVFLNEHFRSLPPIIDFSNKRWYGERLRIMTDETRKRFGDPDQPIMELHHVENGIISNDSQENQIEAQALVDKLKQMLDHPSYSEATFGVICLFEEQVRLVQDLVAEQIDPELWESHDLVVVNPDGFQGDERDVILYSLSFDNHLMSRAALSARQANLDHIQGMLNVGFTRPRDELHVFHSAPIGDFAFADGTPGALTAWLAHCARVQEQPRQAPHGSRLGRSDSIFESEVASRLSDRGYSVTQQYPACGFFIDMVVERDGDRLAVECDGPSHFDEHGRRTVEDLERLDILERAGWRILHITYRRWREEPGEQLERIDAWFHEGLQGDDLSDTNIEERESNEDVQDSTTIPVSLRGNAIIEAIRAGHRDEEAVFKNSLSLLGYKKLGSRIRADLKNAGGILARDGVIVVEDSEYFLTPKGRTIEPYVVETVAPKRRSRGPARYQSHKTPTAQASNPSKSLRYPITCSRCGRPDTVPFRPTRSYGLLCRSCYFQRKRSS